MPSLAQHTAHCQVGAWLQQERLMTHRCSERLPLWGAAASAAAMHAATHSHTPRSSRCAGLHGMLSPGVPPRAGPRQIGPL